MDAIEGVDEEIEEVGQKPATKESRLSDWDKHNNSGHIRKHTVNQVESNFDTVSNENSPYSSRAQNHSHRITYNRSKQNDKYSIEEKESLAKILTKIENDNRNFQNISIKAEKGETKDGEILEEGELADDKEPSEKQQAYAVKAHAKGSMSKSASKQTSKGVKSERRKSGNWGKRNHDSDVKRRKHSYADGGTFQDGKDSGPTWGSSYQMSNKSWPAFSNVEQGYGRGSKGYLSPPGMYDSSSDCSDEEIVPKALMTSGYIDAFVCAVEKQGIFNRHVSLGRKRKFEKNERYRGAEGSFEGPPKKKSLLDMKMFERPACKFYLEGKCAKGGMCQFNHDVEKPKKMEVCKYHLTAKGCIREACQFMHQDFPCKYYHIGAKCFSGDRCKFSHDPLTDATRKALEMRVAAEDIINTSNNGEHRPQEINKNPSLLGSPQQLRPDLKIIPSLFDIMVHPPGHSPKPPASQTVRPSGFYSETNAVSVPSPINNIGPMKSVIASNLNSQQRLANQRSTGGAGLLQVSVTPGNTKSFIGSQQGLNPQHQRFALEPSVKVKNNQQPQNEHMSPVLNMLDAVFHEITLQKGSDSQSNMLPKIMGVNGMSSNLNPVLADVDCSIMGHSKMASGNIGSNKNIEGYFSAGFTKVGNIATTKFASAMGPTSIKNMNQEKNMECNVRLNQIVSSNINALSGQQAIGQESCKSKTDLDCTNQRSLDNTEESHDVCELNKIRQQIQAQLEEEDKKEAAAADDKEKVQLQCDQLPSGTSDDIQKKQGLKSSNIVLERKENSLHIPTNLPKAQQELFKRIRQQQLLQEKELDKQKTHTTVGEDTAKAEIDNWYSNEEEAKPKLTDVLKRLNQEPPSHASGSSSALGPLVTNSSEYPIMAPVASTFNIMQMINAIKSQSVVTKPSKENTETSVQPLKLSLPPICLQGVDTVMSPASPPNVATLIMKSFGILHNVSNCQPPPLAVDPPVVNAVPLTPINYVAVRISLNMPKPYTQLFDSVVATDPAFKDDPRVKWHHSYIEKQMPKEPQRVGSDERPQKQSDPRSLKGLSDSSGRLESTRSSDAQLQRTKAQLLPAVCLASGNVDPRINRQIIQNNQNGCEMFNISVETMARNSLMGNHVDNVLNGHPNMASMSNIGGLNSNVNGLINGQRVGSMCNFSMDGHKWLVQGHGGSPNMIGSMENNVSLMERPMNKVGGPIRLMHSLNMLKGPQRPLDLGSRRMMFSQENTMEDPVSQAIPLQADPSPIGSGVHHLSGPRLRGQEVLNEMHGNSDPRLRHKVIDPRDQRLTVNESQRAISQSINILQSNRVSVNTHEHSNTPHCMESRIFRADCQAPGGGLGHGPCP